VKCHLTELNSINEEHLWRDTRASHHTFTFCSPSSPAEIKMTSTYSIRRGSLQEYLWEQGEGCGKKD